jgi:hypothetical protein
MTTGTAASTTAEDYVVVGLATCFIKKEGKLESVKVIEPIPSAALEAILKGIPTSYEMALGTTYGAMLKDDIPQQPPAFPAGTQFCDEFIERLQATARSYASRPVATEHIAVGELKSDFNFSTERKRTLNSERIVSTEDNVKQHSHTHKVL